MRAIPHRLIDQVERVRGRVTRVLVLERGTFNWRGMFVASAFAVLVFAIAGCSSGPETPKQSRSPARSAAPSNSSRELYQEEVRIQEQLLATPKDASAWARLGDLELRLGRWSAAESAYSHALTLEPTWNDVRARRADALCSAGRDREALREVETALKTDPKNGEWLATKGMALRSLDRRDEAQKAFEAAWKAQPPSLRAGKELARWAQARQENDLALQWWSLCLARDPRDSATRRERARLLAKMGRPIEASADWQHLVDQGEGGAEAYRQLALLSQANGQSREASEFFNAARRLEPNHPQLSELAEGMGRVRGARGSTANDFRPLFSSRGAK